MPDRPIPIHIDTDIGDDIDDALALALAVSSPEVDLRGVTTVFGPVATRTRLALKLLAAYGRDDIPVGTGRSTPLFGRCPEITPNQAVVLEKGERLPEPSPLAADELILKAAAEADGDLTLITIGAMTNAALALLRDSGLARRARLVVMGGVVGWQQAEWNIMCDPEAARVCFESGIPIVMVGLDVTLKCRMSREDVAAVGARGTPPTALLARMTEAWAGTGDGQAKRTPVLHDPLAVAVAFRPELVVKQPRRVAVETRGEFTRAFTVASQRGEPNAEVCLDVDSAAFVRLFMERILSR
jgi:inosine-uridine nucleoside N-ribohydrolase